MKLLVDMNLSPRWVAYLAEADVQSVHWSNCGASNATDPEIMRYAESNGYVVLTHDLDFSAILSSTNGEKPSVVQIRAGDVSPDAMGTLLIAALRQTAPALDQGALVTIDPVRARLRLLPLRPKA
jgi:predicted nuclease of predicted toxin-antitoxin system